MKTPESARLVSVSNQLVRHAPRTIGERWVLPLLVCVSLIGLVLRAYHLGYETLWVDEGYTYLSTKLPFSTLFTVPFDLHPPLYYLPTWIVTRLGDSEFFLRLSSAIAGSVTAPVFFLIARRYLGPLGALLGAAFLALSSVHLDYSQEARISGISFLLMLLVAHSLARVVETMGSSTAHMQQTIAAQPFASRNSSLIGYVFWSVLGLYSYELTGIFLMATNLAFAPLIYRQFRRDRTSILPWAAANVLISTSFIPWLIVLSDARFFIAWVDQPSPPLALRQLADAYSGEMMPGLLQEVILVCLAIGGLATLATRRWHLFTLIVGIGVLYPVIVWLIGLTQPIFLLRTILPALIGGALAIGALGSFLRNGRVAAILLTTVLCIQSYGVYKYYNREARADWRGVGTYLSENVREGDAVLLTESIFFIVLSHYFSDSDNVFGWEFYPNGRVLTEISQEKWVEWVGLPVTRKGELTEDDIKEHFARIHPDVRTFPDLQRKYDSVYVVGRLWTSELTEELDAELKTNGLIEHSSQPDRTYNGLTITRYRTAARPR